MGPVTNPAQRINFRISEFKAALAADDTTRVGEMIRGGLQCNQPIDWWHQQTPLHQAAKAGAVKVVALLIEEGAAIAPQDKDGATPLHLAAYHGHVAVVEKLIEAKSELVVRDKQKYMPLHRAIREHEPPDSSRRKQLVFCLLAENIDSAIIDEMVAARVDDPDVSEWLKWLEWTPGYAAIHLAAQNGPPEAASHILGKGEDMRDNPGGSNKYTPLHLAARGKQAAIATFFLNQHAQHDAKDRKDRTPLHHAVINDCPEIVKRLVEQGADIRAEDKYGFTPLYLARKKTCIKEYLQRKGAYEVIPWYRIICEPCSCYAKNITDSLAPYIGELVPPCYLPKIINPCELFYNLFCCGFCRHKDSQ